MASLKDRCQMEEQVGFDPDNGQPCGAPAVDCPNCGQPNSCSRHLEQASDSKLVCFDCVEGYELMLAALRAKKAPKSEERPGRCIAS
jgi:hypothetical protein